jgi:hypothetical protein
MSVEEYIKVGCVIILIALAVVTRNAEFFTNQDLKKMCATNHDILQRSGYSLLTTLLRSGVTDEDISAPFKEKSFLEGLKIFEELGGSATYLRVAQITDPKTIPSPFPKGTALFTNQATVIISIQNAYNATFKASFGDLRTFPDPVYVYGSGSPGSRYVTGEMQVMEESQLVGDQLTATLIVTGFTTTIQFSYQGAIVAYFRGSASGNGKFQGTGYCSFIGGKWHILSFWYLC